MKIEVGKFYKTRDGRKVGPMGMWKDAGFDTQQPEWDGCFWHHDGKTPHADEVNDTDLIAEWPTEPTGPVRTVTRKEIVPGSYNRLGVGEQSGDCIWVGLVENDGDYDLGSLLNAGQLRALAATLTEIADALEEQ